MFLRLRGKRFSRLLLPVFLTLITLYLVILAASATQEQMDSEALRLTAESVRRATVQCYALEGAYAADLQYLIDNYGIRPDTERFIVHYMPNGGNLLPDITVIPRNN